MQLLPAASIACRCPAAPTLQHPPYGTHVNYSPPTCISIINVCHALPLFKHLVNLLFLSQIYRQPEENAGQMDSIRKHLVLLLSIFLGHIYKQPASQPASEQKRFS